MYKKKPTSDNIQPPNEDPTAAPIIAELLFDEEGTDVDIGGCVPDDGGGGGGGGVKSKSFAHLYSSLLLMSSNEISPSTDWS